MSYPRPFSLKCPDGWAASLDCLSGKQLTDDPPFGLLWEELGEDLIFVSDDSSGFGIDLGWYPDQSPSGELILEVVELKRLAETYANPIRQLHTRSVWEAKQTLEEWMAELQHQSAEQSLRGDS